MRDPRLRLTVPKRQDVRESLSTYLRLLLSACVLLTILLASQIGPARGQLAKQYEVEQIVTPVDSGFHSNASPDSVVVFRHALRDPTVAWTRLELDAVLLADGDYVRIVSLASGVEQAITNRDPQYGGRIVSAIFKGGDIDIELNLAPGSPGARFTVTTILLARRSLLGVLSICGAADNRVPMTPPDPCAVRVVNSVGAWGSGFMIGDNWMITAHHVMTNGPWTVQRNVPASDPNGALNQPGAADQFMVADLGSSMTSGVAQLGNDWAVVHVPDNASGPPGATCQPQSHCAYSNATDGVPLTIEGFGTDNEGVRNGILQTHTGPSVAGGVSHTHFRYRVDTEPGNSGSWVTDNQGRIVGIHTNGGCLGADPETGTNSGTLITNAGLLAAAGALSGNEMCSGAAASRFSARAIGIGRGPAKAGITMTGIFTAGRDIDLTAASQVTISSLLRQVGGGELVAGLPLTLTAKAGSGPHSAVFGTAPGSVPSAVLKVAAQPGRNQFVVSSFHVSGASIGTLAQCPATALRTTFIVDDGANPPLVFTTDQPWRCFTRGDHFEYLRAP